MRHRYGPGGFSLLAGLLLSRSALAVPAPLDEPDAARVHESAARKRSSLEISGVVGPSLVFGEPANPEYTQSFSRVGAYGEIGVAYRSSYFVDPFLSVGYATLASGESVLPSGIWGQGGSLQQHLGAWVISPGITADIWRFRPRLGLGIAVIVQSFEFLGNKNSSTQLPLVTQLGLGFNALDGDRFRIDVEARAVLMPGADVTFATLDAVLRGDLLYFGSR